VITYLELDSGFDFDVFIGRINICSLFFLRNTMDSNIKIAYI
jgi:hypothetical protein